MMLYPVNLKISGRLCVVVGGGNVALRKIYSLIGCHARVTVISPRVAEEIRMLADRGDIQLCLREYAPGDLAGGFLVFSATDDPVVQEQIGREAAERGILLNSADNPRRCDFQVPAKIRRGKLLLTVSTGGASPALSKLIREQLEEQFNDEYNKVISLFARIREVIVPAAGNSAANRALFQQLLHSEVVDLARRGEWSRVKQILTALLPQGVDVDRLVDSLAASQNDDGLSG